MDTAPDGWATFGHPGPSRLLLRSFEAGRLSHAYLFSGPEQIGRRTLALDLARLVNCKPQQSFVAAPHGAGSPRPCGVCVPCGRITRGIHADVRVINVDTPTSQDKGDGGASGDGPRHKSIRIEHVRDLEHQASLKPFEGGTRVFIIDGAELMSQPAANALLKTLEEPPQDVLIVLVASSVAALPATIVSRCHIIELRPVPAEVIEPHLVQKLGASPEQAHTLARLARLARGRPGWAISALADPTALDKGSQAVQRILDVVTGGMEARFQYARQLADTFWRRRDAVLDELDLWSEWWRELAMARNGLDNLVTNETWLPRFKGIAQALDNSTIAAGATAVASARRALEANAIARLALEVFMLDLPFVSKDNLPSDRLETAAAQEPQ